MVPSRPRLTVTPLPWRDPIDIGQWAAAEGFDPWLLLGAGPHPDAGRSHLSFGWDVTARLGPDTVTLEYPDGALEVLDDGPLEFLRAITVATLEGEGFCGGWMGMFDFSFSRHADPELAQLPGSQDALLRRVRHVATFDRRKRTVHLASVSLDGDEAGLRAEIGAINALFDRGDMPEAPPATPPPMDHVWTTSLDEPGFRKRVAELQEWIRDGDHYQSNLATRFSSPGRVDPWLMARRLALANPSPYMAVLPTPERTLVCGSPELLVRVEHGRVVSRPIAGTRKRDADAGRDQVMCDELLQDAKEQAEHIMLVDLVRNDLARVCEAGTIDVPERMSVETYRHVHHLVSRVEGKLAPTHTNLDAFLALFPGGTVTGTPKVRAVRRLVASEPVLRGMYTGSVGYFSFSGTSCWNIVIRSLVEEAGTVHVHAGSGIVADSDAGREWKEAGRKARALLEVVASDPAPGPQDVGTVRVTSSWRPTVPTLRHEARVLLLDNVDSFTHNVAEALRRLGAQVRIVRNDAAWQTAWEWATHVVVGPGPGWPHDAGDTMTVVRQTHGRKPLLGICLGHQAIGVFAGGTVNRHPNGPCHGKVEDIHHERTSLFATLASPVLATRYHSLVVHVADPEWRRDAWLADGTLMALSHVHHPTYGVQFHPESLCTDVGLELLARFLESSR